MISNKDIYDRQSLIMEGLSVIQKQLNNIQSRLEDIDKKTLKPKLKDKLEVERW